MKKRCWDGGLAQRLVSFNEKFTNFYENGALSEFGQMKRVQRIFRKVILNIKSLRIELDEDSIDRVQDWDQWWFGVWFGMKIRLGN